jgi:hypothetical protein
MFPERKCCLFQNVPVAVLFGHAAQRPQRVLLSLPMHHMTMLEAGKRQPEG